MYEQYVMWYRSSNGVDWPLSPDVTAVMGGTAWLSWQQSSFIRVSRMTLLQSDLRAENRR